MKFFFFFPLLYFCLYDAEIIGWSCLQSSGLAIILEHRVVLDMLKDGTLGLLVKKRGFKTVIGMVNLPGMMDHVLQLHI